MGIVAAIARVRAGVKSAGLEGGLSSLGAELKSDAIPPRLRDVAGRLAALLGSTGGTAPGASTPAASVPSLEVALESHAALRSGAAAGAVCPFTGLRADELAGQAAVSGEVTAQGSAKPAGAMTAAPAPKAEPPAARVESEDVSAPAADEPKAAAPVSNAGQAPARHRARSASRSGQRSSEARSGQRSSEKSKERLAESSSVANTSGRSATRPAGKRPRSRAENTRKKT